MKRTIARALRKLANRLDPSRGWRTVNNVDAGQVGAQERLARARRDLLCAERQLAETRFGTAGRVAAEAFQKSWASQVLDGIDTAAPTLPNVAAAPKVARWRRLLRRFGR